MTRYTIPFAELGRHDVAVVGGKNSSLGEMIANLASLGVTVPEGFATTADAYREFLAHDGLAERIRATGQRLRSAQSGAVQANLAISFAVAAIVIAALIYFVA